MAILKKGIILKDGQPDLGELRSSVRDLPDGEYAFYICDKKKSKSLPAMKYLWGVVLKEIANYTGEYDANTWYLFFEQKFAPRKVVTVEGEEVVVQEAKKLKAKEFSFFIEQIIEYANQFLGTNIAKRDELMQPEAQDMYVGAYDEMWEDYDRKV